MIQTLQRRWQGIIRFGREKTNYSKTGIFHVPSVFTHFATLVPLQK